MVRSRPANQFHGVHQPIGVCCTFKSSMRCGLNRLIGSDNSNTGNFNYSLTCDLLYAILSYSIHEGEDSMRIL